LNCSTRRQPINKLKLDPNRYNLYLSDEPKNIRRDPEFVEAINIFDVPLPLHKASKDCN
jgi:hypothetical protein